ncbi:universal stress protein [Vibrio sp. 2-Bac 85]|uniref:universal stress protein n=1 Tax=Psychromonas sp. SA13A TaxID=2686346 RepID=UPI00140B06FC|nr:universal stress protein [Psychromonas sp. SA13A]
MSYRHILVAIDFDEGSQNVLEKAVNLAKALNAKLSLVHSNRQMFHESGYGGLIDIELAGLEFENPSSKELSDKLGTFSADIGYPIERKFIVEGDISHSLEKPVKEAGIDLIVCGHHHDFWSRLSPSASGLMNSSTVDLLVISLDG